MNSSLTNILLKTFRIYSEGITIRDSSAESYEGETTDSDHSTEPDLNDTIELLISENGQEQSLLTIKDINFEELDDEIKLFSKNYDKFGYVCDGNKAYIPFLSNTLWEQDKIKILDSTTRDQIGHLIIELQEEHIGKYIFWMSKYDIMSEKMKNIIQNKSFQNLDFTLLEFISTNLVFIEIELNDSIKIENLETLIHIIRAKTSYINASLFEADSINSFNPLKREFSNNQITIDTHSTTNVDAYSYFINAQNETNSRMKFLDYYHVIEYFFYSHRIESMKALIQKLIYQEKMDCFDTPDDRLQSLHELFEDLQNDKNLAKEEDLFKELMTGSIGYRDFYSEAKEMDINFLTKKCSDISKTNIDISVVKEGKNLLKPYYQKNSISQNSFLEDVATRLYAIRNFIVHSAKYKGKHSFVSSPRFNPDLENDIKLIEKIAYILLNKNIHI